MSIKSELHEAILRKGGKIPTHGGIAAALDELNRLPSGGGVTSWNDLPDKPFGDKETFLLPESNITFADMGDGMFAATVELNPLPVIGDTYTVKYNGVEYNCVCTDPMGDGSYTCLGNFGAMGMDDTGEPFFVYGQNGTFLLMPTDGSASAVASISGIVAVPIDAKYAPNAVMLDLVELGVGTITDTEQLQKDLDVSIKPILKMALDKGGLNVRFVASYHFTSPNSFSGTVSGGSVDGEEVTVSATIQHSHSGGYRIQALLHGAMLFIQSGTGRDIAAVIRPVAFASFD